MPQIDWESASPIMDGKVDQILGDTFSVSLDGGQTYEPRKGFYLPVSAGGGFSPYDENLGSKPRVKMSKDILGDTPPDRRYVRLRYAKLGDATYCPGGAEPDEQGRYWIFDIQKVMV